jgi:hypothetical protein
MTQYDLLMNNGEITETARNKLGSKDCKNMKTIFVALVFLFIFSPSSPMPHRLQPLWFLKEKLSALRFPFERKIEPPENAGLHW